MGSGVLLPTVYLVTMSDPLTDSEIALLHSDLTFIIGLYALLGTWIVCGTYNVVDMVVLRAETDNVVSLHRY